MDIAGWKFCAAIRKLAESSEAETDFSDYSFINLLTSERAYFSVFGLCMVCHCCVDIGLWSLYRVSGGKLPAGRGGSNQK